MPKMVSTVQTKQLHGPISLMNVETDSDKTIKTKSSNVLKKMHHNQVRFIPGKQGRFNTRN